MPPTANSQEKFIPPQQNPLITRLLQSISYLVAYFKYQIKLVIDDRDLAQLKAIEDQRVVYLPNHSTLDDGLVLFLLSARLGQLFHYVVAYEAFQGFLGKILQTVGAYSIRRGVGDRSSIIQTLNILQQPKCKLVIFPEGGCSYQNDTVMPFRSGAIELSFKALSKLSKQDASIPDLYLVPVSLKYAYSGTMEQQLEATLSRLETTLSIQPATDDFYVRLRAIAGKIISNLEAEYNLTPDKEEDWNQRISSLRKHLLNYCEEKLDITPAKQLRDRERVYKIQSVLASRAKLNSSPTIDYEHIYITTVRLLNFDAIYDGYVAAQPTPDRFFATLDRIEREVYQIERPKPKDLRQVIVKIGTPINLKDYWQDYHSNSSGLQNSDKGTIIDNLNRAIQQTVQANLIDN